MDKNQKPKHFLICKILGIVLIILAITLMILANTACAEEVVLGDWHTGDKSPNMGMLAFGGFMIPLSFILLAIGFNPEISKMAVKSAKYTQSQNKEDLTDIANTSADITSEATTKTFRAIKRGLKDTKYCNHCGTEIDINSKFCKNCGKEVE